jgi:hypothetical protein
MPQETHDLSSNVSQNGETIMGITQIYPYQVMWWWCSDVGCGRSISPLHHSLLREPKALYFKNERFTTIAAHRIMRRTLLKHVIQLARVAVIGCGSSEI